MNILLQLVAITILIALILYMTWLKEGEHMKPPLKRRVIIDSSIIACFWILSGVYKLGAFGNYDGEMNLILSCALTYFLARLFQLIAQISPLFQDLFEYIKDKMGRGKE
nr:MAG TPA: hypothetical protein [Caudoviricetes sp.]